ncbi:PepSY domain-containing protein [Paludibacterium yongneupense]|uniref:PepSY domain-containing protein n=1 Tax=Paludibacterium yongneupense TaxID=400061 RepID=UPI000406FCD6|nr:PepSY domain-containing protein [Paludibacterium yongneupense]
MTLKPYYTPILRIHRWLALALAPVFLLILLSGAVLAFKPMVQATQTPAPLSVPALISTLHTIDPHDMARQLSLSGDGKTITLMTRGAGPNGSYDVRTASPRAPAFDIFDVALRLHKRLLLGTGAIVQFASYIMVAIIFLGLLLGWPKLRNTLGGWHAGLAWLALPLTLLTPVTALLMILHLGRPSLPPAAPGPAMTVTAAIAAANGQMDLSHLTQARVLRGNVMLSIASPTGTVSAFVPRSGPIVQTRSGLGWVRMLHEGTWAGAWSGLINLLSALILTALTVTGILGWWHRRRQSTARSALTEAPENTTLIAYASQTGTAARLAQATAEALRATGEAVMLASLATLHPEELPGFRNTLLLVSTTGHGELPNAATGFLQKLEQTSLCGTVFSMLALGDTRYDTFCGGGIALRAALLRQGAQERIPLQKLSAGDTGVWRHWLGLLGVKQEASEAPLELDPLLSLRLVSRERLDDPAQADLNETWHLSFAIEGAPHDFRPGDLLLVSPAAGERERCYSIGSSSHAAEARIELTVGMHRTRLQDGAERLGLASSFLCRLPLGARIEAGLRRHPDFNPPLDSSRPLILIASGSGLAPFPGFITERLGVAEAGPVWLFFGNRKRNGDFFYRQQLEYAQSEGTLQRLDTAFSREPGDGRYISATLRDQGVELIRWMEECGALIYVCGGASTLGAGVEAALLDSLAASPVAGESPTQTLERWKGEGRVKLDLFG